MGDYPDKVEDIYCSRCRKVTEHNIYKKTRTEYEKPNNYSSEYYIPPPVERTYNQRKEVCNECGKTKTTTEGDCCKIM